jgi:ribonucleoside-diphosphate reductase alpha chain
MTAETHEFKNDFAERIFQNKYATFPGQTWKQKAGDIVDDVTHNHLNAKDRGKLYDAIRAFQFLPGGRYIYYAGRKARFYNNCFLLKGEEDTREEWGRLGRRASDCLMSGGGIGCDYSVFRPAGAALGRTGGTASGPIPLMHSINEIGRNVMQGGSRRSAIYASLNWQHGDVGAFLSAKDWENTGPAPGITYKQLKEANFNASAPLDMTNISLNYDNKFLQQLYGISMDDLQDGYDTDKLALQPVVDLPETFVSNVRWAMLNGEPGFSFNFFDKEDETLRNACCEVTSADDSDCCNLGSINIGNVETLDEFREIVRVASEFLVCGTLEADLPTAKVREIRNKNRRLGLGLMGIHEWLLKRGYAYGMCDELREWLEVYEEESERSANLLCDYLGINRPIAYRAIAPTGTIGILAGTTTGIEPLFAVAYKRRYLVGGDQWKYEYVVDSTAQLMIDQYDVSPDDIDTAEAMSRDPERRIQFQADVQDYVDMAISSTLNLPAWGSEQNCEAKVEDMAHIIAKYAHRLRGLTFYPDGSRGGQPLNVVPYAEAVAGEGMVFEENGDAACASGVCGV